MPKVCMIKKHDVTLQRKSEGDLNKSYGDLV